MLRVLRALRRITSFSCLIVAIYIFITLSQIAISAYHDEAEPADAIVVLGTAQWVGRPSPVFRARLDHAIQLYQKGHAPYFITTGGHGPDPVYTEASVGAHYAQDRGVPKEAILMEEIGGSTWESMVQVEKLADKHDIERVIVVSDPFHIARIKIMAEALGLQALGSPTRVSPISDRPRTHLRLVLREILSITAHRAATLGGIRNDS